MSRRRLKKDLETLKAQVEREERFFRDMISPKVTKKFAAVKDARFKSIRKAIQVLDGYIAEFSTFSDKI